eukprot:COSAG02_NODE_5504_length_4276_cov_4.553986_2_plen_228_part_00
MVASVHHVAPAHSQESCPEGAALDNNGVCVECAPGLLDRDGAAGSGPCAWCPSGLFTDRSGSITCSACPVGTFSSGGSASCTKCAPGTYDHDYSATTTCQPCPRDSFQELSGKTTCDKCPPQPRPGEETGPTFTATVGANSSELCHFQPQEYVGCFVDLPIGPTNNMETALAMYDVNDLHGMSRGLCRRACQEEMSVMYMSLSGASECRWLVSCLCILPLSCYCHNA